LAGFALLIFLKKIEITCIFGLFFSWLKLCINFGIKCDGLRFGIFFHKLIWSPCYPVTRQCRGVLHIAVAAAASPGEDGTRVVEAGQKTLRIIFHVVIIDKWSH
jgi:hypothetical protein